MEGTSVLDQNKQPAVAGPAPAGDQPVLGAAPAAAPAPASAAPAALAAEQPQPVLGAAPAAPAPAAPTGEQSVLGGSAAGPKKPITFYKKAWFWIIVAVVILGIAGLVVFLIIQSNITADAIEKYTKTADAAQSATSSFESKFYDAYSASGLGGYYAKDNQRSVDLRDKCLNTLGVSLDDFNEAKNVTYYNGELAVERLGAGRTRELSEIYGKVIESLDNIEEKMTQCKGMLATELKADYKITLGDFEVTKSGYYTDYGLKLSIKNTNSKYTIKYRIEVTAYDEKGKEIATDYEYSTAAKPGKSTDLEIFDYGYSYRLEALQAATFKVTKVTETYMTID